MSKLVLLQACCFFFVVVLRRHWERPSNIVEVLMQHAIIFVSFHVHQLSQEFVGDNFWHLVRIVALSWYGSLLSAGTDRCSQLVRLISSCWRAVFVMPLSHQIDGFVFVLKAVLPWSCACIVPCHRDRTII